MALPALQKYVDKTTPAVMAAWLNGVDVATIQQSDVGVLNACVVQSAPTTIQGQLLRFVPANTNTGPATLNGVAIVRVNGAALTGGELSSLGPVLLQYTGSQWQIVATAGAQPGYERTVAETTAGVIPTVYSYSIGDVRRYNAKLDGVTDDHAAWQAADSQSANGGVAIYLPKTSGGLATPVGLTVSYLSNVVFEPEAFILFTGNSNLAALTIGSTSVAQSAFSRRYERLYVKRQTQSDWSNEAAIGIQLLNMSGCWIDIVQASGFTLGVQTLPQNGAGFQYNKVYLGQIYNNKVAVDVSNATSGYSNENNWYGGRLTQFSGINTAQTCYGVRITSSDSGYVQNNNNHFWGTDIEALGSTRTGGALGYPVLMANGVQNHFHGVRDEGNSTPFATEQNASTENTYDVSYASYLSPTITSTSTSRAWSVKGPRARQQDFARLLFDSGPIHQRACWYDGATAVHIPRCSIADSGSATVFKGLAIGASPFVTDASGAPKYLEVSVGVRGPAIFIRCDAIKQFVVTRDCDTSGLPGTAYGGEVDINCYDATGALVTTAGSIVGTLYQVITSTANFGGAFHTGSDSNNDAFFTVANASVAYLRICVAKSTNNLRIRSFRIWGVNAQADAATWPGYEDVVPGANIGTAAPSSAVNGAWGVGRTVFQAVPVVGNPKAWVCTVAGTPGTWVSQGNL